jgi:hypothetical protein
MKPKPKQAGPVSLVQEIPTQNQARAIRDNGSRGHDHNTDSTMIRDEPHSLIRRRVLRELRRLRFKRTFTSGPSAYYTSWDDLGTRSPVRVRVSDHEVPLTGDRGEASFTWALGWNIIINNEISWRSSYRELVELKVYVKECKFRKSTQELMK